MSFSLKLWSIFVHISSSIALWSGCDWKDLYLLQKLSIDDGKFGQRWWDQKSNKSQDSSQAVTGGTEVNGLSNRWKRNMPLLVNASVGCYFLTVSRMSSCDDIRDLKIRRRRVSTMAAVTWGKWGEVAVVWCEKLTLRSSGGRGRLHNK